MTEGQFSAFRLKLEAMLVELTQSSELGQDAMKTVTLDQQSVGRLSRMDALQQQAMAKAQNTRREQSRNRIKLALGRLDTGDFGSCLDCGDQISLERLDLDPAVPKCISCARG